MATVESAAPVSIAYRQRIEEVVAALGTDAQHGLTDQDARTRLLRDATSWRRRSPSRRGGVDRDRRWAALAILEISDRDTLGGPDTIRVLIA
jgi:hypothetical protein